MHDAQHETFMINGYSRPSMAFLEGGENDELEGGGGAFMMYLESNPCSSQT